MASVQSPPDWRPPRGLAGLAGLRADVPSEARGADGERAGRPRGGRRSGGARQRPEIWRGAAEAGGLAGCGRGRRSGGVRQRSEIWRGAEEVGDLAGRGRGWRSGGLRPILENKRGHGCEKTGDPKAAGCLCVMGDLNPQPAD